MNKLTLRIILVALFIFSPAVISADQTTYDDASALSGVQKGKTIFDINLDSAAKLKLYLEVIGMTYSDLTRQGIQPEIVIAFRGPSVRLIQKKTTSFSEDDRKALESSAQLITDLQDKGIVVEACSIATQLFGIDNQTLLPGIKVVGNTFVSLTGYQAQGYALIPVM